MLNLEFPKGIQEKINSKQGSPCRPPSLNPSTHLFLLVVTSKPPRTLTLIFVYLVTGVSDLTPGNRTLFTSLLIRLCYSTLHSPGFSVPCPSILITLNKLLYNHRHTHTLTQACIRSIKNHSRKPVLYI